MGNPAKVCLFGSSALLVTVGGLMIALWPSINDIIVKSQLTLSPTSTGFKMWRITPIPMYMEFHMYNWTNPHEIKNLSTKPTFTEMGPYIFSEKHEKVNISWKEGDLVEFHQIRTWHFEPDLSNGSLTDLVTNLNPIAVSAVYFARFQPLLLTGLNFLLNSINVEITKTISVEQLLFEGYEDPLLDLVNSINNTQVPHLPFDKFGWFYGRNESWSYDGLFELHTGVDDFNTLGLMTKWNNVSQTDFYHSYCAMVNGSTGELWPPANGTEDVTIFATDLCRSLELHYSGKIDHLGIEGNLYTGGKHLMDNGDIYPDNRCFCGSEVVEESCLPTGVTNVSRCRYGAPAFVSYPHFYLADPSYQNSIVATPGTKDDMMLLSLEPRTGIPLDVEAKLQINLLMQPFPEISIFRNVPRVFIPMLWFNQRCELTADLGTKVKLLLSLPTIGYVIFSIMIVAGLSLFTLGAYMSIWGRWAKSRRQDETSLINDNSVVSD